MTNEHPLTLGCCGLRPQKLPFGFDEKRSDYFMLQAKIKKVMAQLIENHNIARIITGMAIGSDTYCMEAALELKQGAFPDLITEAAIPCIAQESKWSTAQQERYRKTLEQCALHYCSNKPYIRGCMQNRDRYVAKESDVLLAIWDYEQDGGTKITIEYAKKLNKLVYILNPITLDVEEYLSV